MLSALGDMAGRSGHITRRLFYVTLHLMNPDTIKSLIQQRLPDALVEVVGEDGTHFEALVVSPAFVGLSLIKQHQMVYDALGDRMREEIHALSLRTLTPEQAQQLRHPAVH
ncbi:MAG: BolA family protein [Acidithiobacillus sp.]|uniref:BolA/IbaG family iron-sulfur metabolism protein n=1 Tax=Acidithiobacillus ferruginosus TaxID=3063951 RepID=A0ACD5IG55_9PROT|nr:BolA/IbaG family iron-sulfur metabolism protein [Acidithiobacillus ferruginosus]MBU2813457.1 BolA/IbaG family iron-sulfur metabolism protein [Acidithiobacillus ferruginosus]